MIILVQRVNRASVSIDAVQHAAIGRGILAFVGIEADDEKSRAERLLEKLLAYRIFPDSEGRMNLSLTATAGELLLVSQFTLAASTTQGLRPGFSTAMAPAPAEEFYRWFVALAQARHPQTRSGVFGADMQVELVNDGPVTFILRG